MVVISDGGARPLQIRMNRNAVFLCFNFVHDSIDGSAANFRVPATYFNSKRKEKIRAQYVKYVAQIHSVRSSQLRRADKRFTITEKSKMFKPFIPRVNHFKKFESWKPDSITGDVWEIIVGFLSVEEAINLESAFKYCSRIATDICIGHVERALYRFFITGRPLLHYCIASNVYIWSCDEYRPPGKRTNDFMLFQGPRGLERRDSEDLSRRFRRHYHSRIDMDISPARPLDQRYPLSCGGPPSEILSTQITFDGGWNRLSDGDKLELEYDSAGISSGTPTSFWTKDNSAKNENSFPQIDVITVAHRLLFKSAKWKTRKGKVYCLPAKWTGWIRQEVYALAEFWAMTSIVDGPGGPGGMWQKKHMETRMKFCRLTWNILLPKSPKMLSLFPMNVRGAYYETERKVAKR
jgi:hypothetical protein